MHAFGRAASSGHRRAPPPAAASGGLPGDHSPFPTPNNTPWYLPTPLRYVYTRLAPLTRHLFNASDDKLLDYLNEEGQSIEPSW